VTIEDGRSVAGGTAGSVIPVDVAFEANSPLAPVTEMRVRVGLQSFDESQLAEAPWEPFRSAATYQVAVPLGWVGFYVSVQYRDGLLNVSPAYYDDISIEGMPSATP
jgi:hypothetical protein